MAEFTEDSQMFEMNAAAPEAQSLLDVVMEDIAEKSKV